MVCGINVCFYLFFRGMQNLFSHPKETHKKEKNGNIEKARIAQRKSQRLTNVN